MKTFSCWLVSADSPPFYRREHKEEEEDRTKGLDEEQQGIRLPSASECLTS